MKCPKDQTQMVRQPSRDRFADIAKHEAYVCPQCGYTGYDIVTEEARLKESLLTEPDTPKGNLL